MGERRKVLFILHDYPPIHSAGSERGLKFIHYLRDFGYQSLVLTTSRYGELPTDRGACVYRAEDVLHKLFRSLRKRRTDGVPQSELSRIPTVPNRSLFGHLRDRLMIPDSKRGWLSPAVRVGKRLIAEHKPALIFSSSPPETAHLVAARLGRSTRLPWVADCRDGWSFEPPNPTLRTGVIRNILERRLEARTLKRARAVIAATEPITEDLAKRLPGTERRFCTITNGYDQAEFDGIRRQREPDGSFLVVHTGSVSASRADTPIRPFLAALAALRSEDPQKDIRVRFVGNLSAEERSIAKELGLEQAVTFNTVVPRREAHQHLLDADALLLITAPGRRSVASLKLFDYIGAGIPILALAEGNVAEQIVRTHDLGVVVKPDDPVAITAALRELVARFASDRSLPGLAAARRLYERRVLAERLAKVFDEVLA